MWLCAAVATSKSSLACGSIAQRSLTPQVLTLKMYMLCTGSGRLMLRDCRTAATFSDLEKLRNSGSRSCNAAWPNCSLALKPIPGIRGISFHRHICSCMSTGYDHQNEFDTQTCYTTSPDLQGTGGHKHFAAREDLPWPILLMDRAFAWRREPSSANASSSKKKLTLLALSRKYWSVFFVCMWKDSLVHGLT